MVKLLTMEDVDRIRNDLDTHLEKHVKEEKQTKKKILLFTADDLQKKLDFIKETYQYNDYKPFFTDM